MTFCQDIYDMLCRRHPGSKIYVIGDHHFFHKNIIEYTRSEFDNIEAMNEHIINAHNEVVGKDDIVIFLGDFCFKNSMIGPFCASMNGHKYLILGNHDLGSLEKRYHSLGFEGVYTTPIKINNGFLSHEPLIKGEKNDLTFQGILSEFVNYDGGVNYHGHIHENCGNISAAYINVTCEAQAYKPILIGETPNIKTTNGTSLFINTGEFEKACGMIHKSFCFDGKLLLDDYIYSMMLESLTSYYNQSFVQGSFGLCKKYGYISSFSDLDISCFYDPSKSKNKNFGMLKTISDEMYEHLKNIDGINLEFFKRFSNLRIFSASLARDNATFSKCYSDMNLILLDCYRSSDFLDLCGGTLIEKFLSKIDSSMLTDFCFPRFHVQTLKPVGDISNLILQMLFQEENASKKALALKKLHYVYKHAIKDEVLENFLDTFIRFFLRNVTLLASWGRTGEVDYIREQFSNLHSLIEHYIRTIPEPLIGQIYDVLTNPNSLFLEVYEELISTPLEQTFDSCTKIMRKLK